MQSITTILPYVQIALVILLTTTVLLQQSAAGLGGAFGDNFSSGFHTRRGAEKYLFYLTIIMAILFVASSVLALYINKL
jgi:preprotein translocase subunit SecG